VTTYAFPTVAISSITQRITGVALSVGVGGIAASALVGADVAVLAARPPRLSRDRHFTDEAVNVPRRPR